MGDYIDRKMVIDALKAPKVITGNITSLPSLDIDKAEREKQ